MGVHFYGLYIEIKVVRKAIINLSIYLILVIQVYKYTNPIPNLFLISYIRFNLIKHFFKARSGVVSRVECFDNYSSSRNKTVN